ncbi:hypothetical protein QBC38DRAFT_463899 [Podospora fimiseda]|uniref:Xylanolytic transcriptional activator regulatory domain-containing protein n=1 Tax=Podospora fimiseda TaxID=252190 RepID=A0AAN7H8G8_9PEZI|nr:hypothetical protein QBC38DRAFT_463899 [Podospora fimiseda]
MRMATILQLHREESYVIPTPTSKLVLKAESARRTFWMLYSQDCLHFGRRSPKLMHEADISTLLPSDEFDFETAREPESRAALPNTQPALERPELITDKGRSLFATRIQSHYHWGVISRRAISSDMGAPPWEATSEYEQIRKELDEWESGLPDNHLWSEVLLSEYRGAEVDSAYLGVTMLPRLCNIVLRKAYLHEMLKLHPHDPPKRMFWENMATEFFQNVDELWHQVNAQYGEKIEDQGPGAPMAAFCVYTCGFMACYAAKYPRLCPSSSSLPQDGWHIVDRVLTILGESQTIWPFASRWYEHLRKFAWTPALGVPVSLVALSVPVVESGIADDSREPMPRFFDFRLLDSPRLEAMQPQRMYPRNDDNDEWESPDDMVLPPFQQYIEVNPTLPSLNPDREIMPAVPPPPQPPSHPVFVAPAPSLQAQQQVLPPPHSSHLDPMLEIAVPERPDDDSQQYRYELRYIEEWREPDPEEYDQQYPMYVEEQHHYHSVYLAEYPRQWAMEPPLRSRPLPFEPLHPHHIMHSERYPPQQPLHLGPPQQPAHAVSSDERLHQHPLYLDPEQRQPSYGVHSDEHVDLDDLYLDPEEQPAHDVHSDERLHRHPAYPDLQQQPSYPVQSDQHHQHHVVHPPQHLAHANPQQAAYAGQHHPHQAMPPAPMYDPTPIPPEEDHFADALELNDGYEHELRNFVSDGVTESAQPNGPSISRLFR